MAAKQDEGLYFTSMKMKDGLPGSTIMAIEQDEHGFIWIGTNEGLCRFDGTQFKVYRHEPTNTNSLTDNFIQNLHFDLNGNLWIMTSNGLNVYDLEKHKFIRYKSDGKEGELADNSPTDIAESADSTIYISSFYSGISYKKPNEKLFKYINSSTHNLKSDQINCLELIADTLLVIGTRDSGIEFYMLGKDIVQKELQIQLPSYNVNTICNDHNLGLWIGTDTGLSYYDLTNTNLINFEFDEKEKTFLTDNDIIALHLDNQGNLWIGTQNSGLVIVNQIDLFNDGKNAKFSHYYPMPIEEVFRIERYLPCSATKTTKYGLEHMVVESTMLKIKEIALV